jgi:hypothetical protein
MSIDTPKRIAQEITMLRGSGSWSYDASVSAWYFKLEERADPPFRDNIFVEAVVDLDSDGRLAGIEILDSRLLPPKRAREKE